MGNIVLLDDLTINKIAAGEVIERPASVVKELVENSIDAGANNISVEIKNGGISYIRVTDNGKGIMPDDMEIAFERHATSKIRVASDLETVKSMGFRGEALASIAAIAKVSMKSKTRDQEIGHEVIVEGGNILKNEETGCPDGTSITIENLFYNTPVRYKFLKKDFTESGYIEDVMTRIALIHPEIAIKLISSGKTIIQTSGNGDIKNVIYGIYGKEITENILEVNYEYEDIRITGVVGRPIIARSNRSNQLFFVNKRYIKDKTLTSSAEQAYKGMITVGKFGFLVLNIEMDPHKVDVNVHPAKLEVRFEEEQKVFKAVYHAIKDTLLKNDLVGVQEEKEAEDNQIEIKSNVLESIQVPEKSKGLFSRFLSKKEEKVEKEEIENSNEPNIMRDIYEARKQENNTKQNINSFENIMDKMAEMKKSVEEFKESSNELNTEKENIEVTEPVKESEEDNTKILETIEPKEANFSDETIVITDEMKQELAKNMEIDETQIIDTNKINQEQEIAKEVSEQNDKYETNEEKFEDMYTSVFGKAPEKEVEIKEEPEEYKIDAEIATGENISMFEKEQNTIPAYKFIGIAFSTYIIIELGNELYMIDQHAAHERIMYEKVKENYYKNGEKDSQMMLLPDIINLTHKEMDIAKENIDMFEKAGFVLEEFGENTIKLTGVPNICLELDTKELFLETLDEINTVARTAKQEKEEKFIATVACKAAVKAHMALTKEEVDSLMEELLRLPNPFTCPHGRPTAIKMTKNDIEKKFSRR